MLSVAGLSRLAPTGQSIAKTAPAFDLCAADKRQPPLCKGNLGRARGFKPLAGRFLLPHDTGIPGLGTRRKRPRDRPETYLHPDIQTGGTNFQKYGTFAHIFEGQPESKRYLWTIGQVKKSLSTTLLQTQTGNGSRK